MPTIEPPIIPPIPAEIQRDATELGMFAEAYTEVAAGHGPTGNIAWALSSPLVTGLWVDRVRFRHGSSTNALYAWAELRHAIDEARSARTAVTRCEHD